VRDLTASTDIYSLGVILYEVVVGRVPFMADTPYAIVHDHIFAALPLPTKVNPNVPPAVEAVLLRTLAKDPRDRFATANDLAAAFRKAVTDAKLDTLPGGAYRVPFPADAPVNSGTTALDTPRPDVTPVLAGAPVGAATPAPIAPLAAAGNLGASPLTEQMKTLSEARRRQNRRRQQANLWIFIGVAGLILTCLSAIIVIIGAFADPLVRVNALPPQPNTTVEIGQPTANASATTGNAATSTDIAIPGPTAAAAADTASADGATPDPSATTVAAMLQSLLNGSASAADRANAARILYQRASQVKNVGEAAAFRRLSNEVPKSGDAAALAALAALRAGEKAEATRLMDRAVTLSPDSIYVQFIGAIINDQTGKSSEAVQTFNALRQRTDAPDWVQLEAARLLQGR
jgi:hypothetical protein